MYAKFVDATIDPARMDLVAGAVDAELIPGFLEHDGALHGYWSADARTGHVVAITMWRDADALRSASAADGVLRATVGERIGLRLHSVHHLPVLAWSPGTDPMAAHGDVGSIRLAWMPASAAADGSVVPDPGAPAPGVPDPSVGCVGRYWLGERPDGEGCLLSMWRDPAGRAGVEAMDRRHRRSVRHGGSRSERELRTFATARAATAPRVSTAELAGV